jgi:hypothetical protein
MVYTHIWVLILLGIDYCHFFYIFTTLAKKQKILKKKNIDAHKIQNNYFYFYF